MDIGRARGRMRRDSGSSAVGSSAVLSNLSRLIARFGALHFSPFSFSLFSFIHRFHCFHFHVFSYPRYTESSPDGWIVGTSGLKSKKIDI